MPTPPRRHHSSGADVDNYPLLDLIWTMLGFFMFVAWIWLLISLVSDIFRSDDLSGWSKALWTLLIVVTPLVGTLIYLIVRGRGMTERAAQEYARRQEALQAYIRENTTGAPASIADELTKLAQVRDAGTITAEEFEIHKGRLLR